MTTERYKHPHERSRSTCGVSQIAGSKAQRPLKYRREKVRATEEWFGITDTETDIADTSHRAEMAQEAGKPVAIAATNQIEIAIKFTRPEIGAMFGEPPP